MDKSDLPQWKALDVNTEVSVTVPVHVWLGFFAAYNTADWSCWEASTIAKAAQEEMLEPVYLKEQQARHQQHIDEHPHSLADLFRRFGEPPDDPRLTD